jgi:magnesium transporter
MKHRHRARKTGLPPGTLVHIGDRMVEHANLSLIDYTPDSLAIRPLKSAAEAVECKESPSVSWINITGLHDTALLEEIGRGFEIHPLILEDIGNTDQRPKLDLGERHLFIVAKMLKVIQGETLTLDSEQISFIVGPNYLLTFQEKEGDLFDPVRERIRQSKGRLRKTGPDYLAYALLDLMVDNYFVALEALAEEIDAIEDQILGRPNAQITQRIHRMKRTLLLMRKATWPLREMITSLLRDESNLVKPETHLFLRDLYDHTIHIFDTIETYRDMLSGLLEVQLSNINNRMSEVIKVLTIIATIFIPLTFVAGVYGMNFEYMPELGWTWGYPIILLLMFGIGGGMLVWFRIKKWI